MSQSMRSHDVNRALIIGAGIGGMATAIALQQRDIPVDMIEIGPEWKVYGAGITITGPTLRAFRDLGLFDEIAEVGFFTTGAKMHLFDGTLLSTTANVPIEPGLPAAGAIMRPELHRIMSDKVRSLGIDVRIGITTATFDEASDGVDVTFSDGTTKRYAVVVGADGIYSQTRKMLFPAAGEPTYCGQMSWRVVAPRPPALDVSHFFFGHEHIAGINPCSHDEIYAFILHPMKDPRRIPDEEKAAFVRNLLADFGGEMAAVRDGIGPDSSIVQRPFEYLLMPRPWHKGRVTLIGDAVHATTPHLASGAGTAVEDALVLADELAKFAGDVHDALEAFTDRRFDRCKFVVDSSVGISRVQLERGSPEAIGMRMAQAMQKLAEPI